MAVIQLRVPKGFMGHGLGQCIKFGVEYETLSYDIVELTSSDQLRLAKMMVAFRGELISSSMTKNVKVDIPRYEV